jgi:hypothetical protein
MRAWFPVVSAITVLAFAGCGGSSGGDKTTATGVQGPSEVAAEPVNHAGDNPFTPPAGKDRRNVKPPRRAVMGEGGGPVAYKGNLPGLYGGTMDHTTCNTEQLVTFLQDTPDKAAAWAQTLGISTTEISTYVDDLTAVTLRTDVRVTNHGFVGGRANPIQSVLQAGTAVLVNRYGRPVVKCYCGNPLTAPITYVRPTYTGPLWPAFEPTHITIINQSTTVINVFKLYDPTTGTIFARPAGTDGDGDRVYYGPGGSRRPEPEPEPAAPTTPAPTEETPAQPAPTQQAEQPSASFSPSHGRQGDNVTLLASGFRAGSSLDVTLTRPDGQVEHYTINVGSGGSGSYFFTNTQGVVTGTYRAVVTNRATGASASAAVQVDPA